MIPADLRSLLLSLPGVSAAVGARIYPLVIPKEQWDSVTQKPCLVYSGDGVTRTHTFCGATKLVRDSIQIDVYTRDFDETFDLKQKVLAVGEFRGTIGGTDVDVIFVESETDVFDLEPGLFRSSIALTVWNRSL